MDEGTCQPSLQTNDTIFQPKPNTVVVSSESYVITMASGVIHDRNKTIYIISSDSNNSFNLQYILQVFEQLLKKHTYLSVNGRSLSLD